MKIGRKIALFYTLVTVLTTMAVIGVQFKVYRWVVQVIPSGKSFSDRSETLGAR